MKILRDPLVLFLALGALVFVLDRCSSEPSDDQTIVITAPQIERMKTLWQAQAGRAPDERELDAMIESHLREEIFYREAKAMGLDRDDVIIRRRLAQKLSFVLEDASAIEEAGEDELREYFEGNTERYVLPARYTFLHVFSSPEQQGGKEQAKVRAQALLTELDDESWRGLGDPFMLRREYAERTEREITELFGGRFANRVTELEVGSWQGPVESAFGWHLVRVLSVIEEKAQSFEEVRPRVVDDLRAHKRSNADDKFYEDLRERYVVEIVRPEVAAEEAAGE